MLIVALFTTVNQQKDSNERALTVVLLINLPFTKVYLRFNIMDLDIYTNVYPSPINSNKCLKTMNLYGYSKLLYAFLRINDGFMPSRWPIGGF